MELKVGTKVRIRPDLYKMKNCDAGLADTMRTYSGKIVTITHMRDCRNYTHYRIAEDDEYYIWSEDCFENKPIMAYDSLI